MSTDMDLLKLKITALNAEPNSVVVVYYPKTYTTEELNTMGIAFNALSERTEHNFILVPEDIKFEVLPKNVDIDLKKK